MDRLSNVDRLVWVLRRKLEERTKAGASSPAPATPPPAPLAMDVLEGPPLRRAVVANILVDHFGADVGNDASFQQVVTRVTEALEAHPEALALTDRVVADLRRARQ